MKVEYLPQVGRKGYAAAGLRDSAEPNRAPRK